MGGRPHQAAVDATFKQLVAEGPSRSQPGGQDEVRALPVTVLLDLLRELVPEEDVLDAYSKAFPSPEQAIQAALQDKQDFRRGLDTGDRELATPYASLSEILYKKK